LSGVLLGARNSDEIVLATGAGALGIAVQNKPLTLVQTILHTFPTSLIDAMARKDGLQIVAFAVIFAMAVMVAGEAGRPVRFFCDSLTQVMFKFAGLIMKFAPFGGWEGAFDDSKAHENFGSVARTRESEEPS